jgi:hypothetical protein
MQNQASEYLAWIVRQEDRDRGFVRCPTVPAEAPHEARALNTDKRHPDEMGEVAR